MVSLSVRWAYICTRMDRKLLNTGQNPVPQSESKGCSSELPCEIWQNRTSDNPRLFNIPPRNSKSWKKEYGGKTSVECSNKREKEVYKLEDGRHYSTKMWYYRLYGSLYT